MNKRKLLEHLISELNAMEIIREHKDLCLIKIRFKNKTLSHQYLGVMEVFKYIEDSSGYVRWNGYQKQLNKFELILLMGVVKANHHRICFE